MVGIDQHFHEPMGFTPLSGTPDPGHRHLAHQHLPARFPRFSLGHPHPSQGRIHKQAVTLDAVADAAGIAVEHIGGDDLEVVVGGVGEGPLPVAVPHRPDTGHVGL